MTGHCRHSCCYYRNVISYQWLTSFFKHWSTSHVLCLLQNTKSSRKQYFHYSHNYLVYPFTILTLFPNQLFFQIHIFKTQNVVESQSAKTAPPVVWHKKGRVPFSAKMTTKHFAYRITCIDLKLQLTIIVDPEYFIMYINFVIYLNKFVRVCFTGKMSVKSSAWKWDLSKI